MTTGSQRGIFGSILDKFVGRQIGLPPELCSYTVERLQIPLEEDVKLVADLYRPANYDPISTILVLSPYGIGLPNSLFNARLIASRGYQVLASCCRGTFESGGEFAPGRNEAADGHAVVAWMRDQSWYTGLFATLGGSYLGYNQWALLSDPPRDMTAAVIWTGPQDFSDFIWGTGALSSNIIAWADIQRRMSRDSLISIIMHLRRLSSVLTPVCGSVPLLDAVDKYFDGNPPPWLTKSLTCADMNDEWWRPMNQNSAIDNANIPIFLTTGWDDLLLPTIMEQYERLTQRDCHVTLTVGPWTHLGAQGQNCLPRSLQWLGIIASGERLSPVQIFVTGLQEWRDLPKWPPRTSNTELYLDEKKLSWKEPAVDASSSAFVFNPADPTPAVGIPLLFDDGPGKAENNSILASRSDVLVFDLNVLEKDIEVCGKPRLELQHSTDNPNADLWVTLSEVNGKSGYSRSISEKYLRLPADRSPRCTKVILADCAHRFGEGNRIRLMVAGGCHPRYIRNLGTGADPVKGHKMEVVRHTIRHDAAAASKLVLPTTKIN